MISGLSFLAICFPVRRCIVPNHFRGSAVVAPNQLLNESARLRIVHAADLPSMGKEPMLRAFVDEMAQVKPDVLLVTGDIAYDSSEKWFTFVEAQFARLETMGIHVITVPGNHERKGWVTWLRHFGQTPNHRADFGAVTLLSLDSAHGRDRLTPSQYLWLKAQLENARGQTVIIQMHHPIFSPGASRYGDGDKSGGSLQGYKKAFVKLCRQYDVAMVLSGHWHQDAVYDLEGRFRDDAAEFPGTKFVVTTSLGDSARRVTRWPHKNFGYRILEFEGHRLVRYTSDPEGQEQAPPIFSTILGTYLPKTHPHDNANTSLCARCAKAAPR
jgi:3',5'-cyclic AMP phosphodiesterase CpdA